MAVNGDQFVDKIEVEETEAEGVGEETAKNREIYNTILKEMHSNLELFLESISSKISGTIDDVSQTKDEHSVEKSTDLSEILQRLSGLIKASDAKHISLEGDIYNLVSILANNLKGHLALLAPKQLENALERIHRDTSRWLLGLFGFENGYSYFHDIRQEGLLKVCKLALYIKYAKYATDGFTALYTRPPVIYVSAAAPQHFAKELRNQLSLPQSSICTVPCNTMFGSPYTMDVAAFERLLTDDVSCGKTPLILIAFAGTPVAGHTDSIGRLREICTQSGVWLHVDGDTLATLALTQVPPSVSPAVNADSITLDLCRWFGIPNLPACTLYRHSSQNLVTLSGLVPSHFIERITPLPLWTIVQFMGLEDLKKIIVHGSELAQQMCHRLDLLSGVRRIEQTNGVSPIVLFKYKASPAVSYSSSSSLEDEEDDETLVHTPNARSPLSPKGPIDVPPRLCDSINKMIAETLASSTSKVDIELIHVAREGTCMKFNPIRTARTLGTLRDDVDHFVEILERETIRMDTTLRCRNIFEEAFQYVPDIVLIDVSESPGVGAFQCIPRYWKAKDMTNLSDSKKREANDLNIKMITRLAENSQYLHQGKTTTGQICVQIGVVDELFDVSHLAESVKEAFNDLEDNTKFLESVTESIQKSIHEAETKLLKESEEKFFEEDLLRNVPVFSSLYNWWSPPAKDSVGVTGRSFNIGSGKLETTENTYKYKMQVQEDEEKKERSVSDVSKISNHFNNISDISNVTAEDIDSMSETKSNASSDITKEHGEFKEHGECKESEV